MLNPGASVNDHRESAHPATPTRPPNANRTKRKRKKVNTKLFSVILPDKFNYS